MLGHFGLQTVCRSARCPNRTECFHRGTATFMILGKTCTRNCRFCAVPNGTPAPPRLDEPAAVAQAAASLDLRHVVITSVTRDDLPDGGARHFAKTIAAVRHLSPHAIVEVLVPDFQGDPPAVETVLFARPDVFNHNVETVPRIYPSVRPRASYPRTLSVLSRACCRAGEDETKPLVKSGIMLGLGESDAEVRQVLTDLRDVGVDMLTIGQYLSPSPDHAPVARFVSPQEFTAWESTARHMGFAAVAAGPYVRSSYKAETLFRPGSA